MPTTQLDQFIHALEVKAVFPLVLVTIGAGLLGFFFKWVERKLIRSVRSARAARQANSGNNANVGFAGGIHCPICNSQMVKRTARRGAKAGEHFWGCYNYPTCRGTRPI
jgi:hypothetical protein